MRTVQFTKLKLLNVTHGFINRTPTQEHICERKRRSITRVVCFTFWFIN